MPRKRQAWKRPNNGRPKKSPVETTATVLDHDYVPPVKRALLVDHEYHADPMDCAEDVRYDVTTDMLPGYSAEEDDVADISNIVYDDTGLAATVDVDVDHFHEMGQRLSKSVQSPFTVIHSGHDTLKVIETYENAMKWCVTLKRNNSVKLYVHNREVNAAHTIFDGLFVKGDFETDILMLLQRLRENHVCIGNAEEHFVSQLVDGSGVSESANGPVFAYREQDFGAVRDKLTYSATVRSNECQLIVSKGERCVPCSRTRSILRSREYRRKERLNKTTFIHSKANHSKMDRTQLILKLNEQKNVIKDLNSEVNKLRRELDKRIKNEGIKVNEAESLELSDLMSSCESEAAKSFPDENSFQRLFWQQQAKEAKSGRNGMRWHPMIIRWCLYLRQTSNKCYEALRQSGFVKLPSTRTLFDYSHYINTANGFASDTLLMLKDEAEKCGMYVEGQECKKWVGVLFDEIHVKSDLVYNKHNGELIGYVDLDSVGNQILQLQHQLAQNQQSLAKSMLVIMVRGLSTNLQFPMAGFATDSITAEFLYPIVWKAIMYIEEFIHLKVLSVTCDGASANRKFFKLHKVVDDDNTYYTVNPHDASRNIYFVSDVPHLLKTTRNCWSNSYAHRQSRYMWKDGKDISWRHLVSLYELHCENNLWSPCPKLTNAHINLTAFSVMKVNLAAQVLSSTVAHGMEELLGVETAETVKFINMFNTFFDCLNVRHLYEGRNKRNPNLTPFKSTDDPRLVWLIDEFLGYLDDWKVSIDTRPGHYTTGERNRMMLSHQTINGLNISVNSIVQCVKILLESGASFVLTHCFNQDPLEQHFGHYRHKSGSNNNPTVFEVRHTMTQLRTVGAQALKVRRRGNITVTRQNQPPAIDHTPLPRRRTMRN